MERADLSDTLLLCEIAKKTIVEVMVRNANKGKAGRWRVLSYPMQFQHALQHVTNCMVSSPILKEELAKEDLEHALVRLTMALAKIKEEENAAKNSSG